MSQRPTSHGAEGWDEFYFLSQPPVRWDVGHGTNIYRKAVQIRFCLRPLPLGDRRQETVEYNYEEGRNLTILTSPLKSICRASSCIISKARSVENPPVPAPMSGNAIE